MSKYNNKFNFNSSIGNINMGSTNVGTTVGKAVVRSQDGIDSLAVEADSIGILEVLVEGLDYSRIAEKCSSIVVCGVKTK